jgi:hypothetical protein
VEDDGKRDLSVHLREGLFSVRPLVLTMVAAMAKRAAENGHQVHLEDAYLNASTRYLQRMDFFAQINCPVEISMREHEPDDLVAREKLHRDIEAFFAHQDAQPVDRRLYYERRTGQYSKMKLEGTRIIKRRHLIKAYAAVLLDEAHRTTRVSEIIAPRGNNLFQPSDSILPYYTAASALYRFEWLLRNKRIPALLSPTRFHLVSACRLYIHGPDNLPLSGKAMTQACNRILNVLWHPTASEELGNVLSEAVLSAIAREGAGVKVGEVSGTVRFKLNVMQAVLDVREKK